MRILLEEIKIEDSHDRELEAIEQYMGTIETEGDEEFSTLIGASGERNNSRQLGKSQTAEKLQQSLVNSLGPEKKSRQKTLSKTIAPSLAKKIYETAHGRNNIREGL